MRIFTPILNSEEADYVFCKIHEGNCGNHARARSLHKDAHDLVRACDKCQRFANV